MVFYVVDIHVPADCDIAHYSVRHMRSHHIYVNMGWV